MDVFEGAIEKNIKVFLLAKYVILKVNAKNGYWSVFITCMQSWTVSKIYQDGV